MSDKYILKGKTPIKEPDLMKWTRQFGEADVRHVGDDMIGNVRVSTVFLGINHNPYGNEPHLFETMIFGGKHDEYQERCSTWEQAEKMHADAVALVKEKVAP